MAEEIVVREVLLKEAKPSVVHYLAGIAGGALVNFLLCCFCVPCIIPDFVGGSACVFIAKKLSGQKGRVSFGAAALTSGVSGLVAAVVLSVFTFVFGVGILGVASGVLGVGAGLSGKGSIVDTIIMGLFGAVFGATSGAVYFGIIGIFTLVIQGVIKTIVSAIGGVLTSQLDTT